MCTPEIIIKSSIITIFEEEEKMYEGWVSYTYILGPLIHHIFAFHNFVIPVYQTEHPGQMPYECPRYGCDKTFAKRQKLQVRIT
jgi:hypothetical protein